MVAARDVSAEEAKGLIDAGAYVLDVREPDEFEMGHVAGATNLPLSEVPDHLGDLPRDRVIICVCRSGSRSARAASFLEESGFDAMNLEGGMINWHLEGHALIADGPDPMVK